MDNIVLLFNVILIKSSGSYLSDNQNEMSVVFLLTFIQ